MSIPRPKKPVALTAILVLAGATALAADVFVVGTQLRIKDNPQHPTRRSAAFRSKDTGIDVTGIDPVATGATLALYNPNVGSEQSAAFGLPAASWKKRGKRTTTYKYADAKLTHGPVRKAVITNGKLLTFAARGAQLTFVLGGHAQGSIGVIVDAGATRWCALFGGTVKKDTGLVFMATKAPAPTACPPTPTTTSTMPTGTTTTSTTIPIGASVLEYHRTPARDGVYVDAAITPQAAAAMHRDPAFTAVTDGRAYAQPLYVDAMGGADRIIVVTEKNWVYSLDAATGTEVWKTQLAPPAALSDLLCGNIDPMGITGTPIIDYGSHTLYVDTITRPGAATTVKHLVYALGVQDADHAVRAGYPVDVVAALAGQGLAFDPRIQGERGALALLGGTLYVPYGGFFGDCGQYHGWVLGIPTASPSTVTAWSTAAVGGGSWAPGGVASDGTALYAATGNTVGTGGVWGGGEAIIRFQPGPVFSGHAADYFAPTNWKALDDGDVDIGGSGPIVLDVPGATPSELVVALGKNGRAYLINRSAGGMGGISNAVTNKQVANDEIINGAVAYRTPTATYVAFKGLGQSCPGTAGDLTAITIGAAAPPTITTAWCADNHGLGSPMVTTTDGHQNAIVWTVGAEGDNRLHGVDGDTGAVVFAGGGAGDVMTGGISRYSTPIAAKGRIFVAGTNAVYAFTSQ